MRPSPPPAAAEPSRPDRWNALTIGFHWLTLVLIVAVVAIGLYMGDMPNSMAKLKTYALHKSLGLTVLGLTVLRLAWRLLVQAPAPLADIPAWQRRAASLGHAGLYLLLLLVPVTGWLYNSAANFPLQWFGLINLPALVAADPDLKALAHEAHELAFMTLMALLAIHAGAALWHHLGRRDATLERMLPGIRAARRHPTPDDPEHT